MFYCVYKITNQINGKFYIGAHSTKNLDDGYMGSGKRIKYAIEKYGIENFTKEIIGFYNTKVEMYLAEKDLVKLGTDCYNLVEGGGGIDPLNSTMFANPAHTVEHMTYMVNEREKKSKNDPILREKMKNARSKGGKKSTAILKQTDHYSKLTKFGNYAKWNNDENRSHMMKKFEEINHQQGVSNSQFGTMWITNGIINTKIKKDNTIPDGWSKGRKIK